MGRRSDIDWEAVARDYRIGQLSIRQIAEKYGITVSAITRKAKKEGWERDLSADVRAATKAKVLKKVAADAEAELSAQLKESAQESAQQSAQVTFSEIDLAANVNASIILGQQKRIGRLASLLDRMTGELEVINADPVALNEIAEAIEEEDPKAAEAIKRLKSTTTRMNNLKTATEIMGKLNDAENSAFRLGEENGGASVDDFLKQIAEEEGL